MFTHVFAGGNGVIYGVTCEEFGQALYKLTTPTLPASISASTTVSLSGARLSSTAAMGFGWQCIPIEGYAWPMSGAPGDTIKFQVSTVVRGRISSRSVASGRRRRVRSSRASRSAATPSPPCPTRNRGRPT